jgi:hypothetical protein
MVTFLDTTFKAATITVSGASATIGTPAGAFAGTPTSLPVLWGVPSTDKAICVGYTGSSTCLITAIRDDAGSVALGVELETGVFAHPSGVIWHDSTSLCVGGSSNAAVMKLSLSGNDPVASFIPGGGIPSTSWGAAAQANDNLAINTLFNGTWATPFSIATDSGDNIATNGAVSAPVCRPNVHPLTKKHSETSAWSLSYTRKTPFPFTLTKVAL